MTWAKTGSYCLMHFVVAMTVAYALTGDLAAALAIGVVEPFVQTFAFAVHDRYWSRVEGRRQLRCGGDPCRAHGGLLWAELRSGRGLIRLPVVKTVSYSVMHLIVAVTVAFALTGSLAAALAIGLIEPVVQTFAFVLHDRAWSRHEARRRSAEAVPALARVTARF